MNKNIDITGVNLGEENAKSKPSDKTLTQENKDLPLFKKKIAISVSVNEDLVKLGLSEHHIHDISIEIARYIISNGGTALYAGDLRKGGFTEYFSELASQYIAENDRKQRFINYFCFPSSREVTEDVQIAFKKNHIKAQLVPLPAKLRDIDTERKYNPDADIEDRRIYSESFTNMRQQMAKDATARIVVGGKQYGFNGYIPGVIQETLLTLQENKPVYLIGGFGGATSNLISMVKGQSPIELHNDFQYNTEFLRSFKVHIKDSFHLADYDELKKDIQSITLERISDLNKLSMEENEILFTSKNIHEILYLLMKGLKAL